MITFLFKLQVQYFSRPNSLSPPPAQTNIVIWQISACIQVKAQYLWCKHHHHLKRFPLSLWLDRSQNYHHLACLFHQTLEWPFYHRVEIFMHAQQRTDVRLKAFVNLYLWVLHFTIQLSECLLEENFFFLQLCFDHFLSFVALHKWQYKEVSAMSDRPN